jgi:signal transduction histidine kinase
MKKNNSLKKIYYYSVLLNASLLILVSMLLVFLSEYLLSKNLEKRFGYYQKLFISSIYDNVFIGQENEVYRKCKEIFDDADIESLKVYRPNHAPICDFKKSFSKNKSIKLTSPLYFNEQKQEVAATIETSYSLNSVNLLVRNIFFAILSVLFIVSSVFFLTSRILLNKVSKPIQNISEYFSKTLPEKLSPININVEDIKEVEMLKAGINTLIFELKKYELRITEMAGYAAKFNLAKQLSHDIRSPLAALKVVREMGMQIMDTDQSKLLTMSIDRITDIANTILPKSNPTTPTVTITESSFIWMLIDQIVSEKRVEYKNTNNISIQFTIEETPFELNAVCNSSEFMRSISNIINNSIEAKIENKPIQIDLRLYSENNKILLTISDNGKGISSEILPKVFDESFSHGKSQGTGLGLFQVKQAVKSWGGDAHIESQSGTGTKITLELKKSPKPQWLADSISIQNYDSMVILDDEEYVFSILQDRFSEYFKDIRYFKRIEEFETYLSKTSNSFLFIDHDLKQASTGIDLIQKYQLQDRSILLTGNYDDKQVQQRAAENNIKILPKPLINDIPVIS